MIVQDKSVSNGMFSKAGRLTIEMYTLLQEKNHILTGQRGPQSQGFLPNFYSNRSAQNQLNNQVHRSLKPEHHKKDKLTVQNQPFTKSVSRDQIQKIQSQPNISKLGVYTPKYHLIYQRSPLYQDQEFESFQKQNVVNQRKKAFAEFQVKNPKKMRYNNQSVNDSMISQQNQIIQDQFQQQSSQANNSIMDSKNNQSQYFKKVASNNSILNNVQQNQSILVGQNQNRSQFFRNQDSIQQSQYQNNSNNKSILSRRGFNNSTQSISNLNEDRRYLGIDFDKPHKKIVGPVSYDKQSQSKFNSMIR